MDNFVSRILQNLYLYFILCSTFIRRHRYKFDVTNMTRFFTSLTTTTNTIPLYASQISFSQFSWISRIGKQNPSFPYQQLPCKWSCIMCASEMNCYSLSPGSTTRVDGWPVSITRQHRQCWRVMETGHLSTKLIGPSTRVVEMGLYLITATAHSQ